MSVCSLEHHDAHSYFSPSLDPAGHLQGRAQRALTFKELPIPQLGENDVLVKVKATSLNFRDLIVASNVSSFKKGELIPVSDGAGEVVAVGSKVNEWRAGDKVLGLFTKYHLKGSVPDEEEFQTAAGGSVGGWLASHVVYPSHALVRLPAHLSFEEGATLPCAAVTVYNALVGLPGFEVGAGDGVILEGTGGVSVFGLQPAVASGARVVITSSSDAKLAKVLASIPIHAHHRVHTINYKQVPHWGEAAVEKLGGKAKIIVEVGGNTLAEAYKAIARGGVIATIGFVGDRNATPVNVVGPSILTGSILRGILVGSRELFERLNRLLEAHEVHSVIDKAFDFERAPDAYDYLESQKHVGKVVVRLP